MGRLVHMSPVGQFALSGLLAMLTIGLIAVAVGRQVGSTEAVRDAKQVTRLAGKGIVEPNLTPGVLAGDPAALRRLDRVVHERVRQDGIVRVKIWAADGEVGHVVYSDEPRLIGQRFDVDERERAALRGGVAASVSDLHQRENRFEVKSSKLLEVYLPIKGPDGRPLLFEAYQTFGAVSASGRRLWLSFAPALLGGLLLLQIVNLPLARSLARRLRMGQEEREALLHRALSASQTERRRIARDLHDGVVQDLVGVSFGLSAHAQRLNGSADPEVREALTSGAQSTRDVVRSLRTLLVDIYPPTLHREGLHAALCDLARTTSARGLQTTVDAPDDLALDAPSEQLLFRVAQEALRNTVKHAGASTADIAVRVDGESVVLEVADDGVGFDPEALEHEPTKRDHFGLRVLRDLVREHDGVLDIHSSPRTGTSVRVAVTA